MPRPDNRDPVLTSALRALDEDDRLTGASPAVEARLLAEVRSIAWSRRRRRVHAALAFAAALFVAVTGVWLSAWRTNPRQLPQALRSDAGIASTQARTGEVATAFLPLMYSSVPMTEGHLVRLEVPRTALASLGVAPLESIDTSASGGMVLADVLVGEDGLARAVRFVRPSRYQEPRLQQQPHQQPPHQD